MNKTKPQSELGLLLHNNRSFLLYIFRFKIVIRYFINCFRLFWFPCLLWFSNKSAGHQFTLPFSIRIPRLLSISCNSKSCDVLVQYLGQKFSNHHYLAGTRVTVKLALRAGPSGQLYELAITIIHLDIL
jgi:hypothetical protein